jgi:hypothetical protein
VFKTIAGHGAVCAGAECGSFTQAAKRAGLPKSSVSQRISQLEKSLGLRLLNRTTRQLNLTFAGERYLIHCQEMMQASEPGGAGDTPSARQPERAVAHYQPGGTGRDAAGAGERRVSEAVPRRLAGSVSLRCDGRSGAGRV